MKVKRKFTAAGVNTRAHCLVSCRRRPFIVYASGIQLVLQTIPKSRADVGRVASVSEIVHESYITVVQRVKLQNDEIFITGGTDGKVAIWQLYDGCERLSFLRSFDKLSGPVAAVLGCCVTSESIYAASWVSSSDGTAGIRIWTAIGGETSEQNISLKDKAFALCMDAMATEAGSILLVVGTSTRFVELYGISAKDREYTKLLSVAGHSDWIHSIAFNDNPQRILIASAGQDTFVRLWAVEKVVQNEPFDKNLLTSTKSTFVLRDKDDSEIHMEFSLHAVLSGHEDWVQSTTWNADGTLLLTSSSDKSVIIWRETEEFWRDDSRLGISGGQSAGFYASTFSPDANAVVASSYFGGIHAWLSDDQLWNGVAMTSGHVGEVRDVDWHRGSDGQAKFLLSVGNDQTTRAYAWKAKSMVEIARPQVHGHDMQCVAFVSSSVFVSGAEEKIFRAFRAPQSFAASLESISGVSQSEAFGESRLAEFGACVPALGLSNKAMTEGETADGEHWEDEAFRSAPIVLKTVPTEDCLQQNTLWPEEQKLYGHGYEVFAIAVNPRGKVLASSCKSNQTDAMILWDTSNWARRGDIKEHKLTVTQIAWSPDGVRLLSVSRDRTAKLFEEADSNLDGFNYTCVWTSKQEHSRIIWACSWFAESSHFATVARDQKINVWNVVGNGQSTVASVAASHKFDSPVTAVAVSEGNVSTAVVVVGLQNGVLMFLKVGDKPVEILKTINWSLVPVDAAVLRLRFAPVHEVNRQMLAVACFDSKLHVFEVDCGSL